MDIGDVMDMRDFGNDKRSANPIGWHSSLSIISITYLFIQ